MNNTWRNKIWRLSKLAAPYAGFVAVCSVSPFVQAAEINNTLSATNIGNTQPLAAPGIRTVPHILRPFKLAADGDEAKSTEEKSESKFQKKISAPPKIKWSGTRRVELRSDNDQLVMTQFHSAGADVVKAFKHINASSLHANRTWRSDIDTTLKLYEDCLAPI